MEEVLVLIGVEGKLRRGKHEYYLMLGEWRGGRMREAKIIDWQKVKDEGRRKEIGSEEEKGGC